MGVPESDVLDMVLLAVGSRAVVVEMGEASQRLHMQFLAIGHSVDVPTRRICRKAALSFLSSLKLTLSAYFSLPYIAETLHGIERHGVSALPAKPAIDERVAESIGQGIGGT